MFWNRNLAAVVRKVLVIRIVAQDAQTTATESQLANKIFGANGDALNLKSVYDKCSDGAMIMQPVSGNSMIGTDGVYTVSLPTTVVAGSDASDIVAAAIAKATSTLGKAPSLLANHVMFCIPPGTGAWIAYASVNHWQSAYNDAWCTYPSSQAHEVGKPHLGQIPQFYSEIAPRRATYSKHVFQDTILGWIMEGWQVRQRHLNSSMVTSQDSWCVTLLAELVVVVVYGVCRASQQVF